VGGVAGAVQSAEHGQWLGFAGERLEEAAGVRDESKGFQWLVTILPSFRDGP